MFSRVGRKIRILAVIVCALGMTTSILLALVIYRSGAVSVNALGATQNGISNYLLQQQMKMQQSGATFMAVVVLLIGCLISWLSTLKLYAYGQLVDDNELTRKTVEAMNRPLKQWAFKMKNGTVQRESEE